MIRPPVSGLFAVLLALKLAAADATLQFEVVDKCGWRGDRAAQIAESVIESYAYDRATDTVRIGVKFSRKGFAPLPPILAVAVRHGFPVSFEKPPQPAGSDSVLGPLMGFDDSDGYTYEIKGLSRYVFPAQRDGKADVPPALTNELAGEVEKMISAGHLAPWLCLVNVPGSGANDRGDVYWHNPAETLYLLAELLPALPPVTAARLLEYLKSERAAFPPEKLASMPFTAGARREYASLDDKLLKQWEDKTLAHRTKAAPGIWNLYGVARFYDAAGGIPEASVWDDCKKILNRGVEHRDWATLYFQRGHTPAFNAVHGANQLFAGYAGCIRLARLSNDSQTEALAWGQFAKIAALRFAMGKYTQYLHASRQFNVDYGILPSGGEVKPQSFAIRVETDPKKFSLLADPAWRVRQHEGNWIGELVTWNWSQPIHNVRQVHRLDETGIDVWEWGGVDCGGSGQKRDYDAKDYWYMRKAPHLLPFRDLVPETAHFLAEHLKPECEAYVRRVQENQPHAHIAYAEAILGAEIGFMPPCDSYGMFLARAWILNAKPQELERAADVPWLKTGDLHYLHKLAETIGAYRGQPPQK